MLRKATRDALAYRRDNPPEDGEKLIIDAALEVMVSEDQLEDDMITIFVGGFHTSAYRMHYIYVVKCIHFQWEGYVCLMGMGTK